MPNTFFRIFFELSLKSVTSLSSPSRTLQTKTAFGSISYTRPIFISDTVTIISPLLVTIYTSSNDISLALTTHTA